MIFESLTAQTIPLFYKAISFTSHHSLIVSKLYEDINLLLRIAGFVAMRRVIMCERFCSSGQNLTAATQITLFIMRKQKAFRVL